MTKVYPHRKHNRRPRRWVFTDGYVAGLLAAADEAKFQGGTADDIAQAIREKAARAKAEMPAMPRQTNGDKQ